LLRVYSDQSWESRRPVAERAAAPGGGVRYGQRSGEE
jgi:hypothetical protein